MAHGVCVCTCMYATHYSHPFTWNLLLIVSAVIKWNMDQQHNFNWLVSFWQLANRVITKLKEFFCDSPCYNLIGCGNVGLYAALNGSLPSLADWAAKNCLLFVSLSLSVMCVCVVAQPVIELWKLSIFVFLWWCEMWSELYVWGLVGVSECMDSGGGSQSGAWSSSALPTLIVTQFFRSEKKC